tara:strand:+ start:3734 stop:4561 length:828 start_codon:yes stop_codon:yes gene_type:complete
MIERQFVNQKLKAFQIQEHIGKLLSRAGYSHIEIKRTPLGENVIIYTTRPGIVVGKKGENIKKLTALLKSRYKLENPQIEIGEVQNPMLDVNFITDRIAFSLERFGQKRFKSIGYRTLQDIMDAGAIGAEIVISGKVPSARARSWRFSAGYLKKSGDISQSKVLRNCVNVKMKAGIIGVKVSVMTPDIILQDKLLEIKEEHMKPQVEEVPYKTEGTEKTVEVSTEPVEVLEVKEEIKKKLAKKSTKKSTKKSVKKAVKKSTKKLVKKSVTKKEKE